MSNTYEILEQLQGKSRFERGQAIAQTPHAVKRIPKVTKWQLWKVASQTTAGKYYSVVDKGNDFYECDCKDFDTHRIICKHVYAVILTEVNVK
jgi:SWIM zinc finger